METKQHSGPAWKNPMVVEPTSGKKTHRCKKCKAILNFDTSLIKRHYKACKKRTSETHGFKCKTCKRRFTEKRSLTRHQRNQFCSSRSDKKDLLDKCEKEAEKIKWRPENPENRRFMCHICQNFHGKDRFQVKRHLPSCLKKYGKHL